ncbi:hypothetical protein [Streptomyces sp. NPDC093591]|uniref:hypothetical protein n=1 Tax=Streptomyces sp. NPDC093591 TaxID=3366044 RepID=UPI003810BC7B
MKKWREDAQPEWPEAVSEPGGDSSPAGSRGDTQAFPATGETEVPGQGLRSRSEARETEILHGGGRASSGADKTEILRGGPRAAASDAEETAVLPAVGRAADPRRTEGKAQDAGRPIGKAQDAGRPIGKSQDAGRPIGKPDGWSAFDRPSARRNATPPAPRNDAFLATGETRAAAVRDPWAESAESAEPDVPGATHDPHEVTVQLDGIGLQLDNMLRAAKDAPGGGEGSDGPVFVDESGRRSRRFRRIGMAVGLACAVYAVVIVATLLSGNSDAPWLPVERPKEQPAGQVDTPPLPAESAPQPSGTGSVSPDISPTATADTTVSPGVGATAPDASPDAEEPGASAAPKPSATKPTANPDTDPTPDPDPTVEPTTPDPDPSPTDIDGPAEEPTDPPTIDEPAGGTVANGPSDPTPIAQEPDASASVHAAPSPEYTL